MASSINISASTFFILTVLGGEILKNFSFMDKLTFVLQFWKVELDPFIFKNRIRSGQRSSAANKDEIDKVET